MGMRCVLFGTKAGVRVGVGSAPPPQSVHSQVDGSDTQGKTVSSRSHMSVQVVVICRSY
jgi:hypothetical protein